jgi:2-oxo-4-hydroxy-4-carboxy-5-ureidoimidazoline decarboxylase
MNATLAVWNTADSNRALESMLACCGARRWAEAMVALRPIDGVEQLCRAADREWSRMEESDWLEAFDSHPRIGERKVPHPVARSAAWSAEEQSSTSYASQPVLEELASLNAVYEQRFGFTYIVCASGKTAGQMLAILKRRLENSRDRELAEAAEEQRQILQIRLGKWLIE